MRFVRSIRPRLSPLRGAGARRWDAHRRALRTMLLLFAATFVIFIANNVIRGTADRILEVALPMIGGDMLIALPLVWLMTEAGRGRRVARWGRCALATLAVASAQAAWDTHVRVRVGTIKPDFWVKSFANAFPIDIYNTGMLAGLLAFQAAYHRMVAQQRALTGARARERKASLAALRLQLNPHFLFNTMNALSGLVVVGRNADAETMIERLSDFLRHVLSTDPARLERLDEEIALIEAYLAIEQVRFGDRLVVSIDLPVRLTPLAVPPFVLQPLVENAIKYGVSSTSRPVTIRIAAAEAAGMLVLSVTDDGVPGETSGGFGVGLANIRERLSLLYGVAASLEAGPLASGGYAATVRLPLASLQPSPSADSSAGR